MKSWTDWFELSSQNIRTIPQNAKGVYAIRRTKNIRLDESDIIYIGNAGTGRQGLRIRLQNLLKGLNEKNDKKSRKFYYASPRIKKFIDDRLQLSWIECFQMPDGVEKAFLLAFFVSVGKLPLCNKRF